MLLKLPAVDRSASRGSAVMADNSLVKALNGNDMQVVCPKFGCASERRSHWIL